MAVNQTQVDHIITEAASDDPLVKIQNLEREIELIKTSIKRILIDIRERMNELENPLNVMAAVPGSEGAVPAGPETGTGAGRGPAGPGIPDRGAAPAPAPVAPQAAVPDLPRPPAAPLPPVAVPQPAPAVPDERRLVDEQLLAQFKAQLMGTRTNGERIPVPPLVKKSPLQKVHKLFRWTGQAVQKYGHDRLEIMLQSYRTMGHISKEAADEIREIAKLMPASIGAEHEVGPDEFVSELYTLNRIIAPDDITLDRDMIEVMMEQRSPTGLSVPVPSPPVRVEVPAPPPPVLPPKEKKAPRENDPEEDWMNLPDRI